MTDILTEQNFICNDNALVINDLQRLVLQFLMEEGGGGEATAPNFNSEITTEPLLG